MYSQLCEAMNGVDHIELDASVSDAQCLNVHFRSCTFFPFCQKNKISTRIQKAAYKMTRVTCEHF